MHKILPAIFFCLALPAAFATPVTEATDAPPLVAREGMVRATLVVPAAGAAALERARPKAAAPDDEPPGAAARDEGPQADGMLLAALALMLGIVLRRWGGGHS